MSHVLSIQSHVAFGYAGNKAAIFPLQRLGHEVSFINILQYSNHTGYDHYTGRSFSPAHLDELLEGLQRTSIPNFDAVLTGYLSDSCAHSQFQAFYQFHKEKNKALIYCCDPVLGDHPRGYYTPIGVREYLTQVCIPMADIVTPNQFEIEALTQRTLHTPQQAFEACRQLCDMGPKIVVLTSFQSSPHHPLLAMAVSQDQGVFLEIPYFPFKHPLSGTGDMFAAIFLGKYLEERAMIPAFEHAASATFAMAQYSYEHSTQEIPLIQQQSQIVHPTARLVAKDIRLEFY